MNLAVSVRSEYSIVKSMVFPVVIYRYELDRKEGWALQNWCFQIVVLEKTLESDLDSKEIKPFNPKGNQPWIFIGRADAEAEVPVLWPTEMKSWLTGKDPDAGKDRRQKEKGWQRMRQLDSITHSMDMNLSRLQEGIGTLLSSLLYGVVGAGMYSRAGDLPHHLLLQPQRIFHQLM